jgi:hypothetical protein
MAETLIDKNLAKERLKKYLETHDIEISKTREELYSHSETTSQTQEEIQAEVDEFLQLLEESRKYTRDRLADLAD